MKRFCPAGEAFHLARCHYEPGSVTQGHAHDFAELFWVTQGQGMHTINGRRQQIEAGDLVAIRPDDEHALASRPGRSFTIINLAFAQSVVDELGARYVEDEQDWLWAAGPMPITRTIDRAALAALDDEAERLARSPTTRLCLDAFLLRLIMMLSQAQGPVASSRPSWLITALAQMDEPEHLRGGAAALAGLCDRSIEHVNRVIKRHMNCTASELVNELRVDRAARLLRMSDQPIVQVAMESGYDNLGYFYRRFKQRFGQTPRQYRLNAQAVAR